MKNRLIAASFMACCSIGATSAWAGTSFLHHFDAPTGTNAGDADFGGGSTVQRATPPDGPGGTIVAGGKFGTGLNRASGGRIQYDTAGNYYAQRGTIEMFINYPSVQGFGGLWSTVQGTSAGAGDIRMYIFAGGGGAGFGGYMTDTDSRWECETTAGQFVTGADAAANTWHHVAWTWDTAAGTTAIYWDGIQRRSGPDFGTVNNYDGALPTQMHIGENQLGSATFNGLIDEFRISDQVLYTGNFAPPTAPFATPVPEPTSLSLLGLAALVAGRRRR